MSKKISVIVPAFNEEKLIARSLRAITAAMDEFTRAGFANELIVCDNNSTDRTAELARLEGARVVFEPVNQIARARNTGASEATGDWLVFVDADSFPSAELFAAAARVMSDGQCVAGGSTVKMDHPTPPAAVATHLWNLVSRWKKWAAGSFIFCEAHTFRALNGFNEELFASEEIDLFRRLNRRAKIDGREIVILHRTPLVTSARKLRLYSQWEHLRLMGRALLRPRATLKSRAECHIWYDGRR